MAEQPWHAVDEFVTDLFGLRDAALDAGVAAADTAGLPHIQVSAAYGAFLNLMVRAVGARHILEIGTLGGYSATWLARGLPPQGRLVTLELDPRHAQVARANLDAAGVGERVEIVVGPAAESLARLAGEGREPFDLVFIDADKTGYSDYLELSLALAHRGTLIIADNVVRQGSVALAPADNPSSVGIRHFLEKLATDDRVDATVIQTVGAKGYDGMAIAIVR